MTDDPRLFEQLVHGGGGTPTYRDRFVGVITSSRRVARALTLVSAKQPASLQKRDWYPYYAGFTEAFVNSVAAAFFHDTPWVLDPWSGSGTTTAACSKLGLPSIGVDINPALTVIAKARLTSPSKSSVLKSDSSTLLAAAREEEPTESQPNDLLRVWIQPRGVGRLRAVQRAIHRTLMPRHPPPSLRPVELAADTLPIKVCFYYSVLFFVVRDLLARFRTSNPMWLKAPRSDRPSRHSVLGHHIHDLPVCG